MSKGNPRSNNYQKWDRIQETSNRRICKRRWNSYKRYRFLNKGLENRRTEKERKNNNKI